MQKCLLMILDGYGESEILCGNAVKEAATPNLDGIFKNNPTTLINAGGLEVGLPAGQMGNSEVGHLNIGAGRIVYQELTKISKAIHDGDFFEKRAFFDAVSNVKKNDSALHIIGLTSDGGVHSAEEHYFALIELAKRSGLKKVFVHCFTDGRDTNPDSGLGFIENLEDHMAKLGTGKIATVCGRYYAMDRDNRYERVQRAYDLLTNGTGEEFKSAAQALKASYEKNITDEFVEPAVITSDGEKHTVRGGDSVIFFNFRADRARQLTKAFTQDDFSGFERVRAVKVFFVSMTEYEADLKNVNVAFAPERIENTLGEYLSRLNIRQLRIAETEKYAHVTYFFNGGEEVPNAGEDRILVPSPKVATYDMKPEMSANEVCEKLVAAISGEVYGFIAVNYANCDMVGHTGVYASALKAVEAVDRCVGITVAAAEKSGYSVIITADHGNAEKMLENGKPFTAHTTNPVKFCVISPSCRELKNGGSLCDVAPSVLALMELTQPPEMSGTSLVVK